MRIEVRAARADDWPFVRDLWNRLDRILGPLWYITKPHGFGMPDMGEFFVAENDGALCGFSRVKRGRDGCWNLKQIGTAPDARRCGVARAMVAKLPRPCEVQTDEDNAGARRFYSATGWVYGGFVLPRNHGGRRKAVFYLT